MAHESTTLAELISTLKQERDELKLKAHLASAEAKEEWDALRGRLDKLLADYEPVKSAASESAGKVSASLKTVGEEILAGFHRIRKSL